MTGQRRTPRTDPKARRLIHELHHRGWTPVEIHAQLESGLEAKRVPSQKTVYRLVKGLEPHDPSGAWSLSNADPEDAELVLPVLRELISVTDGRKKHITSAEAGWIAKLRRAEPTIPLMDAYATGREYLAAAANHTPVDDLDARMAFAPWRNAEAQAAYEDAHARGLVRDRVMVVAAGSTFGMQSRAVGTVGTSTDRKSGERPRGRRAAGERKDGNDETGTR